MNIFPIRNLGRNLLVLGLTILGAGLWLWLISQRVLAASPIVRVGQWNAVIQCVDGLYGPYDVDTFTRDALAGEVYSSWPPETLKANAIMIRSGAVYYANNPQSNYVCNNTGMTFHLRTSTYQGWGVGKSATDLGLANNRPNDRATDTGGMVLKRAGALFFPEFQDCAQNYTQQLGNAGWFAIPMLTAVDGVYGPNRPPSVNCVPVYNNLSVQTHYPFLSSMMNGTVPYAVAGAVQDQTITEPLQTRQAENYWGMSGIDAVSNQPFGQTGKYAAGILVTKWNI
jgi:hypothetical protein